MVDIWKNWSEKEKQAFYRIFEIEQEHKALQTFFSQIKKKYNRSLSEKLKSLYYRGLVSVKRLLDSLNIPLTSLPNPEFFEKNELNFTTIALSHSQLKSEIEDLSNNPSAFSNCMQVLGIYIKSKLRQPANTKGIPLLLKQTEGDIICHFCGRIKRRRTGSILTIGVSDTIGVQLLPLNAYYHKALVRCGFTPRLEIYMRSSKLLAEIIEHLNNKWHPEIIENSPKQEFTVSLMAPWEGKFIEYNKNQEKITIGDVHMSLESPASWHLYYYWKPVSSQIQESMNTHSDHSLLSTSMLNLIEEKSNSIPFLSSQMVEDSRPFGLSNSFQLAFNNCAHEPFSKGDSLQVPDLRYSAQEIHHDLSLSVFRTDGDESMFSSWFNNNHKH
ncbi:unnamed protein product [Blepharisma stoltei]|uniref:Uncharacterized protein n=1 Tax=Blepharisma stoltei TaxID=1481888 RepID=A0AAU9JNS8_9CILI|nr:unnamed protein product [Blepharisma stoltei]